MQIPTGGFGNRLPQVRQTKIENVGAGQSQAMATAFGAVTAALEGIAKEVEANAKVDAENSLFQYQKDLNGTNEQVMELYNTGKITYDQMRDEHKKLVAQVPTPQFDKLDEVTKKTYQLSVEKLNYNSDIAMLGEFKVARQNYAKNSIVSLIENTNELLQQPNSDLGSVKSIFNDEAFNTTGKLAFGEAWDLQKKSLEADVEKTYLQNQITNAASSGDIKGLRKIRTSLLDEKQFLGVNNLEKTKLIKQLDPLINISVGKSYGQTLTKGVSQLVDKTGDFSAVKTYQALSSLQKANFGSASKAVSIEDAKKIAENVGVTFDEQKFLEDSQYAEQLQQQYFSKSLDRYGSPIMAAIAIQAGDKKLDGWLKEFGDPRKDQISVEKLIANIPDANIKKATLEIARIVGDEQHNSLNIQACLAAIDNDKTLNDNQKKYAKAVAKQSLETMQEQHQTASREIMEGAWRDICLNKTPIDQIAPERLAGLSEKDANALLEQKSPTTLDLHIFQEARGRVKSGENVDILAGYYGKLPDKELGELIQLQQDLRNDPARRDGLFKTTALIDSRIKAVGIINAKEINMLKDSITDDVDSFEKKNGRVATQREIIRITDRQFVWVKLDDPKSLINDQKRYYKTTKAERSRIYIDKVRNIPSQDKREIEDVFKLKNIPPTDENFIKYYNKGLKND